MAALDLTPAELAAVRRFGLDKPEPSATTTNEALIAEAGETLKRQEWMPASLVIRLRDALAAVPVHTEAEWRKAIADQVRRNCTPSTEAYKAGGDALIYAVCDWIENPPAWSAFTAPVPAPKTQDGEAREALVETVRSALSDALLCGRVWEAWSYGTMTQDDFMQAADDSEFVSSLVDAILARYNLVPVSPEDGETK